MIAERFRARFGVTPQVIASAPGRVNLIGEHTDYNDGFVLPMTIDRRLRAAVSVPHRADGSSRLHGDDLGRDGPALLRALQYTGGVIWALRREHPSVLATDTLIASDIPIGAGLASSAALEIAYARALCETAGIPWDPMRMARLAQEGENEHLGVRCGIMDQAASAAGRRGNAMLLDCRTLDVSYVEMPANVSVVVMDTGTRRALGDTEYNARRAACEEAVREIRAIAPDVRALRDVAPELLRNAAASLDAVTHRRARHVVEENLRPAAMAQALRAADAGSAGQLMSDSHASLRDLYEVSSAHLDLICDAARAHPACYGARMTGAGFGGCAIALVRSDAVDDFIGFAQPRYEAKSYRKSNFFAVHADDGARLEPLS